MGINREPPEVIQVLKGRDSFPTLGFLFAHLTSSEMMLNWLETALEGTSGSLQGPVGG